MELRLCDSPGGPSPPGCETTIPSGRHRATALDVVVELHPPACGSSHGSIVPGPSDTPRGASSTARRPPSTRTESARSRRRRGAVHRVGTGSIHSLCDAVEARRRGRHSPSDRRATRTRTAQSGHDRHRSSRRVVPLRRVAAKSRGCEKDHPPGSAPSRAHHARRTPRTWLRSPDQGSTSAYQGSTSAGEATRGRTPERRPLKTGEGPPGWSGRAFDAGRLRRSRRPPGARWTSRAGGTSARSPSTCARACRSRRG